MEITASQIINYFSAGQLDLVENEFEGNANLFRALPPQLRSSKSLMLYRGISAGELAHGPKWYSGHKNQVQRLTSWTLDASFARKWAGEDGYVIAAEVCPNDIAICLLGASRYPKEREIVVIDYHLRKFNVIPKTS